MNTIYNTIFINGQAFNCYIDMSLQELLQYLEFESNSIVVEHNSRIIHSTEFDKTFFKSQDKVEIITIVGGG
uniref:Thiamine biosynthesis protein n=1 Tax=Gracilaria isabellana TaxID=1183060 RepID=UPI001D0F6C83|nr:Thiamine biosynthesis protein [Gracilaria isabellana]YP_010198871.1 Thiamine biosynthesis protein [Gracilaria tikvahiae]UAD86292.1 Thiamine biosynthesis protein [Gracilaria isabellana]UAD88104.1 Thiamine biosynthesis protein [Gracilaria tikvahiae]UAD88307.1 Thiamine biosynthesis protein [Gracilaria tikvahiae]